MNVWQKILIPTLIAVLIGGGYVFFVFQSRRDSGAAASKAAAAQPLSKDDLAVVMQNFYASFDAAKEMEGKPVWIKAGYSLPYYPYAGKPGTGPGSGTVEFAKRVGELPAAEKLQVLKLVKAVAPAKENNRVPHGSRQYFVVFTFARPDAPQGNFAAPIGYADGQNETLFCDQLFYYDDPRKIYDHWPASVWDAVAAHEPRVGMTENQVRMAVGILLESDSTREGDRTVTYHAGPKTWTVTFVKGAATEVKEG